MIALGGNAITRPGEPGTIPQQFEHTAETLDHLIPVFRSDARIVVTHGNGPQIGNILIRVEEGERRVPRLPLDTCVSDSQGGMGYMIQRIAFELFRRERIDRTAVTVITQVLVSEGDPDLVHPTQADRALLHRRAKWRKSGGSGLTGKWARSLPAAGGAWCRRPVRSGSWKRRPSRAWWRRAWW